MTLDQMDGLEKGDEIRKYGTSVWATVTTLVWISDAFGNQVLEDICVQYPDNACYILNSASVLMEYEHRKPEKNFLADSGCVHEMKTYIGLTDIFKYCVKCDKKET